MASTALDFRTLGDVIHHLGDLPPARIRLHPSPGTATVADLAQSKHCELLDGTLVEKPLGMRESILAGIFIELLRRFVIPQRLGLVGVPDCPFEIQPGLVRMPDVAFVSRDRLPEGRIPHEAIPELVPNLVVEILSASNTRAEMHRKRQEYFDAGVQFVWEVDPEARTIRVYNGVDQYHTLTVADTLDGGEVLPGFTASIATIFGELDQQW